MTKKINNHSTTFRLPKTWHQWIEQFAEKWDTTPSYVYRAAIKAFIRNKQAENR